MRFTICKLFALFCLITAVPGFATVPVPTYIGSTGLGQFSVKVSDALGVSDIDWIDVSIGAPGSSSCMVQWNRGNYFWLFADNGSTALGGYVQGTNTTITNSQCLLKVSTTNATVINGELWLWLDLQFLNYTGVKTIWMVAGGSQGHDGWHQGGSVMVGQSAIPTVSLSSPAPGGTGTTQNFTVRIVDTAGTADISWMNFTVGPVGANSCMLQWNPGGDYLQLYADNGSSLAGGGSAGSGGTVQNSRCQLNLAGSSGSTSGPNTKYVTFALTLLSPSAGVQPMYAVAGSSAGNGGWSNLGNWTISGGSVPPDQTLAFTRDFLPPSDPSDPPAIAVSLAQLNAHPDTGALSVYHVNDSASFRIRFAKPNTQVWGREQSIEEGQTVCPQYTGVVVNNGACLMGMTDSGGFFEWNGQIKPLTGMRTVQFYVGAHTPNPSDPSITFPMNEDTYIGGLVYFVIGLNGLPVPPYA